MQKLLTKYKGLPVQMKASLWFLICSFMQRGISFITTPIFTRLLSTAEYGQFSVFNSWMSILTPVITLNLYSGVYSQGLVKFEKDRNIFSSSLQGLMLTIVIVWLIIYIPTRSFWNGLFDLSTQMVLPIFVLSWLGGTFQFWSMDQRVDFKYRKLVIVTIAVSVLQPAASIVLILNMGNKVMARILGMVLVQFVFYSWTFVYHQYKGKKFFSKEYWKYALKFNIPLLPHYLSLTVLSSSDRIMISRMAGDDKAGIYNLAYSLSMIMTMFNTALLQTVEPWIYRKLKEGKAKDIAKVAYPTFAFIAFVNILLIMFAPEAVRIFAPSEYYEAIYVVPSVTLSVYFMYSYTFFATFEFYYEKTKYVAAATVGGALLNIVLNYIFIKKFGYIAAGYTTLFGYMLFAILHYCFMNQICKQYMDGVKIYDLKILLIITAACLAAGFSFLALYNLPIVRYTVIAAMAVVIICMRKKLIPLVNGFMEIKKISLEERM